MNRTVRAFALGCCLLSYAFAAPSAAQPVPGGYVEVQGGKLWYESCGAGLKTMVLLHDGVLPSVAWDDVWPALCRAYRVVRYDRRGYGRSPSAQAPYSAVDDTLAVMRAAGMEHAALVGASAGGGLAIDFTLSHPKLVDQLVLVGPQVSGIPYSDHFIARLADQQARIAKGDVRAAISGSWVLAKGDTANTDRLLKLLATSSQDAGHLDTATPSPLAAPRLGQIKAPTLILIGEEDIADNQAQAGAVEYAVNGARRVVISGAGHMLYLEKPAEFTRALARFIDPPPAVASLGTEAALRRVIDEIRRGELDYGRVSPTVADAMRKQSDQAKRLLAAMGALKSIIFQSVSDRGADVYVVTFEKRRTEWRIKLGEGGRVENLLIKL